ncbi:hypothetical protein ACFQ14_08830 [Pseudahrensia aquimaris]|uniref:Gene product 88 domain-containing protein n=1 Tax=Pseudahrensia aquimaris TaxID=744461 RepID=A0ABW3FDG4_9HYPH
MKQNRKPKQRHTSKKRLSPICLAADDPAIIEKRSLHPNRVRDPNETEWVLKSGMHSRKYGDRVAKGTWVNFPVFSFTLEERATCPAHCSQFAICFGNRMSQPRAYRYRHGQALTDQLETEFQILSLEPETAPGTVVRAHTLGDFYSISYVSWWAEQLARHSSLHVWGYTAWTPDCHIGIAIAQVKRDFPNRFRVRWSNRPGEEDSVSVVSGLDKVPNDGSIVCPYDIQRVKNCAECGICWESRKHVVFLEH